jgi:capsular exopolysaccharide synthesis family protein
MKKHVTHPGYEVVAAKTRELDIDPRIIAFYDPDSPVSEQYRILRTNLCSLKRPVSSLVVTSATHGEGKSITAANLAITLANAHDRKRILLVDGDLRRANVHKYLGMKEGPGITEIIRGETQVPQALQESGIPGLSVLQAGAKARNPAELLGSQAFIELTQRLKSLFDFVLFDAPPVIPVTDAGLIVSHCDGALIVIQAGRTQRGVVRHCTSLLRQAQGRILGYVVTNIRYHIPAYIYRYL